MRKFLFALVTVLMFAVPAVAQTAVDGRVEVNKTFAMESDHDGNNTDFYDFIQDGTVLSTLPVSARVNGVITFSNLTIAQRGVYTIKIRARNLDDLQADSDPFTLRVSMGQPNKPSKPRAVAGFIARMVAKPVTLIAGIFTDDEPSEDRDGFGSIRLIQ